MCAHLARRHDPDPVEQSRDIQRRLGAWLNRGDQAALWPQATPGARARAHSAIVEATAAVLADRGAVTTLTEVDPAAVAVAAHIAGMAPLLHRWIVDGRLRATPAVTEVLARHHQGSVDRAAELDGRLGTLLDALGAAGVVPVVLKGSHTAHAYFPEPAARPRADLDLMIAARELPRANQTLAQLGYALIPGHALPDRVEWRLTGSALVPRSLDREERGNPWAVDLHTELRRDYHRGCRRTLGTADDLPLERSTWCGRAVLILAEPALSTFLAVHTGYAIAAVRLVRLVELVWVLRRDTASGLLAWPAMARFLAAHDAMRFVYPALELAERLAPGTLDPAFRRTLEAAAPARMRRVVDDVARSGMQLRRRSLDDRMMWAAGPLGTLVAVADLLWPTGGLMEVARLYGRRAGMIGRREISVRATAP